MTTSPDCDQPSKSLPTSNPPLGLSWSNRTAQTDQPVTPQPTHLGGLNPSSLNQSTNTILTYQPLPETKLLRTDYLVGNQASNSSFQHQSWNQPHTTGPPTTNELLIDQASYETHQLLYQNQFIQNSNHTPQPLHDQSQHHQVANITQFVPNQGFNNLTSDSGPEQPPFPKSIVWIPTQTPRVHSDRNQKKQGSNQTRQQPVSQSQLNHVSDPTDQQLPIPNQLNQTTSARPRQLSSQIQLGNAQPTPALPSNNPPTNPNPSTQTPNPLLTLQLHSNPQITTSAFKFWSCAQTILTVEGSRKYHLWHERHIAYDIAATLMLSGIYLDQVSSVNDSAAWLEWAFSVKNIWNRRPIANIPRAVPNGLLRRFKEVYGDGRVLPVWGVDGRLAVLGDGKTRRV